MMKHHFTCLSARLCGLAQAQRSDKPDEQARRREKALPVGHAEYDGPRNAVAR